MKDVLNNKIQQLAAEADVLVTKKMAMERELVQIDTRLTQIAGAMVELNKIAEEHTDQEEKQGDNSEDVKAD